MVTRIEERLDALYDLLSDHFGSFHDRHIFRQSASCDIFLHDPFFCYAQITATESGYVIKGWFLPRNIPASHSPLLLQLLATETPPLEETIPYHVFTAAARDYHWFPTVLTSRLQDLRVAWFNAYLPSSTIIDKAEEYEGYMHFTGTYRGRNFSVSSYDYEVFVGYEPDEETLVHTHFPNKYFNVSTPIHMKDSQTGYSIYLDSLQSLDNKKLGLLLGKAFPQLDEIDDFHIVYMIHESGRVGYEITEWDETKSPAALLESEWGIMDENNEVVAGTVSGSWIL